jgi:hypothetical protein
VVAGAQPPGAVPAAGAPNTVAFGAVGQPQGVRPTVQFMQAVQPAPGSPLAAEPAGAQLAAAQMPAAGPAPVDQVPAVQEPASQAPAGAVMPADQVGVAAPEHAVPGASAVGDQVVAQVPAVLGAPGAIAVSSHLLTSGQETFVAHLSQLTGLSPRVAAAWTLAEESGSAAQARQAASNYNWLNIGYFDSGAGKIAFDKAFSDPVSAAEQTANFLKGNWGGASPSIRAILSTISQSPEQQMSAIANSDWASSHYYGGSSLRGTYAELGDMVVQGATET